MLQVVLLTSLASPLVSPAAPQPVLRNVRSVFGPLCSHQQLKIGTGRRRRRGRSSPADPALAPVPSRFTKAASGSGAAAASLVLQTAREKLPGGAGVSPDAERAPGSAARPGAPCHFNEELRQHLRSSGARSGVTVPMVPSTANSARLVYQRHVETRI